MKKILVIGSSNTDLIVTMEHFPVEGETIEGNSFQQAMGGKGANQAVAAKRAGGNVMFITSVGDDVYGRTALDFYKKEGIDVSSSRIDYNITTGTALIWVNKKGENSIVIISGANKFLTPDYLVARQEIFDKADIIVLQMEIPYETVKTICGIAYQKGKKVILNVAPACSIEDEILKSVYILVVNENEAEVLTKEKIEDIGEVAIIDKLLAMGVSSVLLTLGNKGCIFNNGKELLKIPAFRVDAVDTTAAGDTFCGALATGISKDRNMKDVLVFASAAAALCVTRLGAQPSIPNEKEVNEFLKSKNILI